MCPRNHVLRSPEVLSDVAMATNFGTKIAIIVLWWCRRGCVVAVGQQNSDIADTLQPRDVATATIFCLCIYGMYICATWRIRLNRPCAVAMRPYVNKLLWPLVNDYVNGLATNSSKLTGYSNFTQVAWGQCSSSPAILTLVECFSQVFQSTSINATTTVVEALKYFLMVVSRRPPILATGD